MDYRKIMTIEPGRRSGKRCIRGMRITVGHALGYLASGKAHAEILEDFENRPRRTSACLANAADRVRFASIVPANA